MSAHNLLQQMVLANHEVADPGDGGTIVLDRDVLYVPLTTGASGETRIAPQPEKAGMLLVIGLQTDGGGDCVLTVTEGWNQAADTTLTFGDAGDWLMLHSVLSGSSYYWRVLRSEGIAETITDEIDVHALTALGAVPDVADLLPVSDEGTASDPTRSVTVTQLLTAAGDLTDLGSVPAVDDRILLTDESVTGDPAKSTTVENLFSALGDVTALGAAPDATDILALTDESATGDPIKAVTVQQLFDASGDLTALAVAPALDDRMMLTDEDVSGDPAKSITIQNVFDTLGDLTDLGSVPAVDDRIALTDESESGDPAKSTTVENLFSALGDVTALGAAPAVDDLTVVTDEGTAGDPVRSVTVQQLLDAGASAVNSTGVGAKNGATVTAAEGGFLFLHKTTLTLASTPIDNLSDEAGQGQYGGVKIYDFPDGLILFLGAVVQGTITLNAPAIDNWDGDVGLGLEAPADHQDVANKTGLVMNKNDVSAGGADKIGVVAAKTSCTALTESGARWIDGTAAPADLYLNFLLDDNGAHDNTIDADCDLTVTFWWINLGDLT